MRKNKLIYIGGPTCSGKTKLSILLAESLKTDIVSCDSRQIYKETSLGTAKPSNYNLKKVKHHFINHVSIHSEYNVGIYYKESNKILESIFKGNAVPPPYLKGRLLQNQFFFRKTNSFSGKPTHRAREVL